MNACDQMPVIRCLCPLRVIKCAIERRGGCRTRVRGACVRGACVRYRTRVRGACVRYRVGVEAASESRRLRVPLVLRVRVLSLECEVRVSLRVQRVGGRGKGRVSPLLL